MKAERDSLKEGSAGVVIDLLRGGLALMVLAAHALESALLVAGEYALPEWLKVTLGHGGFWVNGFFVLSGFCIQRSVLAQRRRGVPLMPAYAEARLTRLYPVYLVALVWVLLFSGWPGGGRMTSHLLMTQGVTGVMPSLKPAWSLTYEAAYYALWPLVLVLCGWRTRRAVLLAVLGSGIGAAVLMLIWKHWMAGAEGTWVLPMALVAAQFPLWLGGAWLAGEWERLGPAVRRWMMPAGLLWIIVGYAANAWALKLGATTTAMTALGWLVTPGWLLTVLGGAAWDEWRKLAAVARWCGLLSYPLYILHQVLLDMGVAWLRAWKLTMNPGPAFVLLFLLVMLNMLLWGVRLEAACLGWRARFLARRRTRELETAPA